MWKRIERSISDFFAQQDKEKSDNQDRHQKTTSVDETYSDNIVKDVLSGCHNIIGNCVSDLAQDHFLLSYDVLGGLNLGMDSRLCTANIHAEVRWDKREISVETVTTEVNGLLLHPDLRPVHPYEALKGRTLWWRECTGFDENDMDRASAWDARRVWDIMLSSQCSHKLTRIVKGWLNVFWLREHGETEIEIEANNITYSVSGVVGEYDAGNHSYIWVSEWETDAYLVALLMMCDEYGIREHQYGHVKIPGEENIYVVSYSDSDRLRGKAVINWNEYTLAMRNYALSCHCGEDLDNGLIIATFLRENKYFDEIRMPRVVSRCDLILPALDTPSPTYKPMMVLPDDMACKAMGRTLNATACLIVRDALCSFKAAPQFGYESNQCNLWMHGNERNIRSKYSVSGRSSLVSFLKEVLFFCNVSEDDLKRFNQHSYFELGWVGGHLMNGMPHGLIQTMCKGRERRDNDAVHRNGSDETLNALYHEMALADARVDGNIPEGAFVVRFRCKENQLS